jgi:flavin-dependent dehydrogenase
VKEKYDVIVAGAGPAGLLAAKALAQNGFDVAMLERKAEMSAVTRACGQSLLPPNEYFFGDLFHYNARDGRFCFPLLGLSFPYTGPVKSLHAWHMFSPGMNSMQFGGVQEEPIALSYDKETMLACLLDEVKSAKVDLLSGTECLGFQPAPGGIVVETASGPGMCSYLIAADGTNSRIVEQLGYNNNRRHIANLYAKSFFIEGISPPHDQSIVTAVSFIEGKPVYLFLLPRPAGDAWNLLVLTLEGSVDVQAAYETLVKDSRYAPWFKNSRVVHETAAVERIYSPIIKPFRNNVLIVGDAGGCQELECLGAMISGWRGGCAVAAALKEHALAVPPRAIAEYEDWWLNTYIKQYDYQDYLSVFGLAYTMANAEVIDYVFGLMGETAFPPTFNPYRAVGLLGERLQGLMPRIMAERPDILQQLAGTMGRFPSDIMAGTLKE